RDLEGARDAADRAQQERRARELGELADLAAFAESPEEDSKSRPESQPSVPDRMAAEQAQKLLLWLWLQEERLAELSELAAGCARDLSALAGHFGEGAGTGDGAKAGAENGAPAPELALQPGLIPPWRPAAASAALFVSEDTVFFVEGPMREELLDNLDFRPAPEWGGPLGCAPNDAALLVAAEAPLWRALGRPRPEGPETVRVWITWGRP
ncbi:MAG: hypothetical protein K2G99_01225, partial [Desulfovibrio sp.]|nr:hypothetical protein [Desulfovibrio sp.]